MVHQSVNGSERDARDTYQSVREGETGNQCVGDIQRFSLLVKDDEKEVSQDAHD